MPIGDLLTRDREMREGIEAPGWTADTLERILTADPVVTIARIDEYSQPWFDCTLERSDGAREDHSFAVMDDDSWEPA